MENPPIRKLHDNIELIASGCIVLGLVFMQNDNPGIYTQTGIYLWAAAQVVLIVWWDKRLSSATACMCMGALNLGGAGVFFAGNVIAASSLGMFISCCYMGSSLLQLAGGAVRTPMGSRRLVHKVLATLLARKILIAVSAVQALGGMCFIILTPLAGICFTSAAFMALTMNILRWQVELMELKATGDLSVREPGNGLNGELTGLSTDL